MKPSIHQKFIHRFDARSRIVPGLIAVGSLALALQSHAAGVMPGNPVSAYRLDEANGSTTTTVDSFGSVNGTFKNGATASNIVTSTVTPFAYTGNRSLDLSSTSNTYVDLGNPSSLFFTSDFSISVWARPTATVNNSFGEYIVSDYIATADDCSYSIRLNLNGKAKFFWDNAGNDSFGPESTTDLDSTLNVWHHIVATWDATTLTRSIYINGNFEASTVNAAPTARIDHGGNSSIGRAGSFDNTGFNFDGLIDEVAFFNYSLNTNEVTWLNTNSISAIPEPGPFGLIAVGGCMLLVSKRRRNQL